MRQTFVPKTVEFVAGAVLEPYGDIANTPTTAIMAGTVLIPVEFGPRAEQFGWARLEGGPEGYVKLVRDQKMRDFIESAVKHGLLEGKKT